MEKANDLKLMEKTNDLKLMGNQQREPSGGPTGLCAEFAAGPCRRDATREPTGEPTGRGRRID
jgi:hypothetical protein